MKNVDINKTIAQIKKLKKTMNNDRAITQLNESRKSMKKKTNINTTLAERGNRYGEFCDHARITQNIKIAMAGGAKWSQLSVSQKESLEMIAHKIGRILNGDPNYHDSWHDIAGYATLVADQLLSDTKQGKQDVE